MGRYKKPYNAECVECHQPFRVSEKQAAERGGCRRCPACRTGKQGTQPGGRKGWHQCECGNPKGFAAVRCRECYLASAKKGGPDEEEDS